MSEINKREYVGFAKEEIHKKLQELLDTNQLVQLKGICNNLLQQDSKSFLGHYFLGQVYFKEQKYDDAELYFNTALGIESSNADLLCNLAIINFYKSNLIAANNFFLQATRLAPNDFDINYNYIIFLTRQENYQEALRYALICKKLNKESEKINILLANLYELTANFNDAIASFEQLVELGNYNSREYIARALLLLNKQQDHGKTIAFYKKLIASYPSNLEYYNNLLAILQNQQRLQEVVEVAKQGLQIYPDDINLLYYLSGAYFELEQYELAHELTKRLKDLDPQREKFYEEVLISIESNLPNIDIQVGQDKPRIFNGSWYRGKHTNYQPSKSNLMEGNAIDQYVLFGRVPEKPFINKAMKITTFGSCFAQNVTAYLRTKGFAVMGEDMHINSHVIRCGEGMVNTFAILQQFEWAYENKKFSENLWYDSNKEIASYDERIRNITKDIFDQTEVFIITLGLSEIWYNKVSQEVFWRAIPKDKFDEQLHGFRVSSVQENIDNIKKIYQLIKKHKSHATIIFTLSPIPLNATFRPISCISANSVSKAILRSALDEVLREYSEKDSKLFYYPSYEIVKDFFVDPYEEDNRHVKPEIIKVIMERFEKYFCIN